MNYFLIYSGYTALALIYRPSIDHFLTFTTGACHGSTGWNRNGYRAIVTCNYWCLSLTSLDNGSDIVKIS